MKEFTLTAIYEAVCQCHDSSFEEKLQCLSNNDCPKFSDKELITIYFWGKAQQLPTRKAIYRLVKQLFSTDSDRNGMSMNMAVSMKKRLGYSSN